MFKQVTLKNFRTHKLTSIELHPVTLLIGNNNSGKTNLLLGIQHFSQLVKRGSPSNTDKAVYARDFFPHRYRSAGDDEPITFSIQWDHHMGEITYEISLYKSDINIEKTACVEEISIKIKHDQALAKKRASGQDQPTYLLDLRQQIENDKYLIEPEKYLANLFFIRFSNTFSYHFQPDSLKGLVKENLRNKNENLENSQTEDNLTESFEIPAVLGENGGNFQDIVSYIKEHEQRIFSRFIEKMRTLGTSFQGVHYGQEKSSLIWEFDLSNKGSVEEFMPDVVSDGFMKIAAISLLTSLLKPPGIIIVEEIENGIDPGYIRLLMHWIWQAASPSQDFETQFILTSHSPGVLREFNDYPDHVYIMHLDRRRRQSDVINLNTALDTLAGIGTIRDDVEYDSHENNGKQLIIIPKYRLAELWYSGTIG